MSERKKILWLVSWYPNKYDVFDGDFIQRHARAAALLHDVHVLFVKQKEEQKKTERNIAGANGLSEQIIYLPKRRGPIGKLLNYYNWQRHYKAAASMMVNKEKPSFIHVHVPWKAGLIALWTKKRFAIPYIVTEHWGIYNNEVEDNIHSWPFYVRRLLKKIFREATTFASVSRFLGEAVNELVVPKRYSVIPNVVDTTLFQPSMQKHNRFTFIHVSNMVPLKNVGGILEAFKVFLVNTNADAQLVFVGNKNDKYERLAQQLGLLNTSIFFKGEIPYDVVAAEMQKAHVLVINSNIENSPCVIGEALCCGLPVIATKVGGIPELVDQSNGLLVPSKDAAALTKALTDVYQNYSRYQNTQIAAEAKEKFSPQTIAAAFSDLYSPEDRKQ